MILSCPECETQYTLKAAQIGPRGRTVRCTHCRHTWHAEIPVDLRYSEPKALVEEVPEPLAEVKAKKLPGKYRAMLEDKKRMRALAVEGAIWGGLAALAILVLTLGYALRVNVVRAFPRIAGAYAMVGLDVKGTNLRFTSQSAETTLKGGRFVVTVKAQVKNLSDKPERVPPVRVKMLDSTLQQFGSVLMPSDGLVMGPHATRTLTFDVADPENKVASLNLDFDLIAQKAEMKNGAKAKPAAAARQMADIASGSEDGAVPAPAVSVPTTPVQVASAQPVQAQTAPAQTTVAAITPAADDTDVAPQDADADTAAATQGLSMHPAHALRGALSFGNKTLADKTGHGESKS